MDGEGCEEGYGPLEEGEPPEPKKKRKTEEYLKLPTSSTIGLDSESIEELQAAYEILQTIMKISKIEAFLVKPNSDLYGMSTYYNIIKKPMWLNEVNRKLMDREYKGIKEVIADIKLLLENCYRFWGPSHRVTKKGLHIEHKLEQKLEELPIALKTKCLEIDEPCEIVLKTENTDECVDETETPKEESKVTEEPLDYENECNYYSTYKGFHSKILNKVLSTEQDELCSEESLEEQKKREQVMLTWEKEALVNEAISQQIKHMSQLAEIGQFLKLTAGVLNVEEITQYEVERMLLMPKESTTLATLMTSMLSPAFLRSNLDVKPVMPYELWTAKLKKKVEDWAKMYYKTDALSVFNVKGIEPYFWDIIGLVNPLEKKRFHEISFFERVWIVKSLCDNLLHTNKSIQDVFEDETRGSEFRAIDFGRGQSGSYYFGLEFFPEIRVYKQNKVLNKVWSGWTKADSGIFKLQRSNLISNWIEEEQRLEFLPNPKYFSTEADSVESLVSLIDNLKSRNFIKLTENLSLYLNKARKHKYRLEGLEALYSQWHDYQKRAPEYFSNLLNHWLLTENPASPTKEEEKFPVLGKRRSATKTNTLFTVGGIETSEESSEELFESDVSDWEEESVSRRNRKKKNMNSKRRRSKCSITEETPNTDNMLKVSLPSIVKNEIKPSVEEVKNITNNIVTQPPVPPVVNKPKINVMPIVEIKKEVDDVITISSDEEEVTSTTTSNHAGPPPPPPPPPPTVAVPAPPVTVPASPPPAAPPAPKPPLAPGTKIGSSVVVYKVTQRPPSPVRMPQPMIETLAPVVMPKPIQEMVRTPRKRPVPMPIQEPPPPPGVKNLSPLRTPPKQSWIQGSPSPRNRSPLASPTAVTPRLRTPPSPRTIPPAIGGNMIRPGPNIRTSTTPSLVQRNLFPSSPMNTTSTVPSIEGTLHIGPKADGSYGYHVRLPDGGIINMSREDIEILRQKNNGNLPNIVKVPLVRQNNRIF